MENKYKTYLLRSLKALFKETDFKINSLDDLDNLKNFKTSEKFSDKRVIKAIKENVPWYGPRHKLRIDISTNYLPEPPKEYHPPRATFLR